MRVRILVFSFVVTCAVIAGPTFAQAQASKAYRIAFVSPTVEGSTIRAFREGLGKEGYVEGKNVTIEARFAEGHLERLPRLMAEVLRENPDVLVTGSEAGARAAKSATKTIPIVFAGVSDPLGSGLVASLSRPGGNITGVSFGIAGSALGGKWVELLRSAAPSIAHVAVLSNSSDPQTAALQAQIREAARALNAKVSMFNVRSGDDLDSAFTAITASGAQGLIVTNSPVFAANHAKLVRFSSSHRLPAMYFFGLFADAGGLMSYGGSIDESYRTAASLVAKVLRGARPADTPIEQPTRIEFVVNLKTARALGLTIPQSVLLRADRIIE